MASAAEGARGRSRSPRRFGGGAGRLEGKVAVVTGGATGIGAAICARFAAQGARLVIADINATAGEALVERLGGAKVAIFQRTDVTDEASVEACMDAAVSTFGRLDVLVNNAVLFLFGHLLGAGSGSGTKTDRDITSEDWSRIFNTNVVGYANCIKHAARHMRKNALSDRVFMNDQGEGVTRIDAGSRGSIVNIGSVSSYIAQPEFVPYNATKGAVLQLTKCCAMDFAPQKIRVNAVLPGTVDTQGSYNHMRQANMTIEAGRKAFGDTALLKRQAAPEEIADGVLFLASDEASFMTGAHIVMDGGGTI